MTLTELHSRSTFHECSGASPAARLGREPRVAALGLRVSRPTWWRDFAHSDSSSRQQVWIEGHPSTCWIGNKLVVQIDGFEHHLYMLGIAAGTSHTTRDWSCADSRVLRFDYAQVVFGWAEVESTILMAVAQGLHR